MVKWEVLCKPKEFGGMGFSDTRIRNICLLSRWIFRLENDSQDLSYQIPRKKYMGDNGFFLSKGKGSQFWTSLHKIKRWFKMATSYEVGDGRKTLFWHDVWWGKCPFKILFPSLFECCEQMDISVNEALRGGEVNLSFCRSFGPREVGQWEELGVILGQVSLDAVRDKCAGSGREVRNSLLVLCKNSSLTQVSVICV
jgi:hypothetical protein